MEDTLFSKVIRGDLPSWRVYEDEKCVALLDIYPVNKGHVLVIPKEVYANVHDLPEDLFAHLMKAAKQVASAVKEATHADGINIIMNNGKDAGQIITDHAHIHIVPRYKEDGLLNWPSTATYEDGEKEALVKKITDAL